MGFPSDLKYSDTHEWAKADENGLIVIGITKFAVEQLQDLVFIDLPKTGTKVEKGRRFGEIESVKAVSDLISPVEGEIVAVNDSLSKSLDVLASDPYTGGWMIKVRAPAGTAALDGMLDASGYERVAAGH
jgi:glycine cleavage system H protein